MKKLMILTLACVFLLISAVGPAGAGDLSSGSAKKVPTVALEIIRSSPAAAGKTMFELAAVQINRWIDDRFSNLPKAERPYVTPQTAARAADSLVRSYRAGDRLILTELAMRIPYDLSVEEKVDILEKVTTAYLEVEAKKR